MWHFWAPIGDLAGGHDPTIIRYRCSRVAGRESSERIMNFKLVVLDNLLLIDNICCTNFQVLTDLFFRFFFFFFIAIRERYRRI